MSTKLLGILALFSTLLFISVVVAMGAVAIAVPLILL